MGIKTSKDGRDEYGKYDDWEDTMCVYIYICRKNSANI